MISIYIILSIVSISGISYFALLWKSLASTKGEIFSHSADFKEMKSVINAMVEVICKFEKQFVIMEDLIQRANARMIELENEIRMQKADSSRLVEWLDIEGRRRKEFHQEVLRNLKNEEREKIIVELANRFAVRNGEKEII